MVPLVSLGHNICRNKTDLSSQGCFSHKGISELSEIHLIYSIHIHSIFISECLQPVFEKQLYISSQVYLFTLPDSHTCSLQTGPSLGVSGEASNLSLKSCHFLKNIFYLITLIYVEVRRGLVHSRWVRGGQRVTLRHSLLPPSWAPGSNSGFGDKRLIALRHLIGSKISLLVDDFSFSYNIIN